MYKLIIADDEPKIRTLLRKIIDWSSFDFEVAGVFSDGKEVLDYLKHDSADCILCDICMNDVSGIDIAEYVYNNVPQTTVMFLSGYQNFSYATAALKYGVENYFLKPVQIDEISDAFKHLKEKLDAAKNNSEFFSYYRRDLLSNLANGFYKDFENISRIFRQTKLSITPDYACALLTISFASPIKKDSEALMNLFQNIAMLNQTEIMAFYLTCDYHSVKYILFSDSYSKSAFYAFSNDLCQSITDISCVSSSVSDFSDYQSVMSLCDSFKSGINRNEFLKNQEQALIFAINSGSINEVCEILSSIADFASTPDLHILKRYYLDLFESIKPNLLISVISDYENSTLNLSEIIKSNLENCVNHEELFNYVNAFFTRLAADVQDTDIQKKNILRVRNYISTHFNEDISLEQLARMAYLSPTYFSRLFKNIIGTTYIDFLTACKMNKTKDLLLNSSLKINEISIAVGYRNIRSFTKSFKQNCGMSPSEYRNKFSRGGNNG